MSDPVEQNIRCPHCQREAPFTIWRSLNVTLNPAEKQSLITGDLFRFTCPRVHGRHAGRLPDALSRHAAAADDLDDP